MQPEKQSKKTEVEMKKEFDVKKLKKEVKALLKKTQGTFKRMGEDTAVFAKRGEKELSRLAKIGKAEMDILNLTIRKNQLFYRIGQKVYNLDSKGKLTTKNLKKLCQEIGNVEKNVKSKKRSMAKYLKRK